MSADLGNSRFLLMIIVIVVLTIACSLPSSLGFGDEGAAVETRVAQTMTARSEGVQGAASDTPISAAGTATPTLTDTLTSVPTVTETPTPQSVTINVSGDTFCRTGPGSVYDQKGILNTGEESEILAKDPGGNFWYIVNPDNPGDNCWVWGRYATPVGPTTGLPVYTPPPSPTPSLAFSYDYLRDDCGAGGCYLWFAVKNSGGISLESFSAQVDSKDGSGSVVSSGSTTSNSFLSVKYDTTSDVAKFNPGQTVYVSVGRLPNPLGSKGTASMRICSQDNLNGDCLTKNINFDHDVGSR